MKAKLFKKSIRQIARNNKFRIQEPHSLKNLRNISNVKASFKIDYFHIRKVLVDAFSHC